MPRRRRIRRLDLKEIVDKYVVKDFDDTAYYDPSEKALVKLDKFREARLGKRFLALFGHLRRFFEESGTHKADEYALALVRLLREALRTPSRARIAVPNDEPREIIYVVIRSIRGSSAAVELPTRTKKTSRIVKKRLREAETWDEKDRVVIIDISGSYPALRKEGGKLRVYIVDAWWEFVFYVTPTDAYLVHVDTSREASTKQERKVLNVVSTGKLIPTDDVSIDVLRGLDERLLDELGRHGERLKRALLKAYRRLLRERLSKVKKLSPSVAEAIVEDVRGRLEEEIERRSRHRR